jgi:hypothetical protein
MKSLSRLLAICGASLVLACSSANAASITVGTAFRTGTLSSAVSGATANTGNLGSTEVNTAFGGTWTNLGSLSNGTSNGFLTISFLGGTGFGDEHVNGTWSIDPTFWTSYNSAVIGWHVGNGGGDPDSFMFKITPLATSGTWSYDKLSGGGGGFSNIQLYGANQSSTSTAPPVPDGGSTAVLLGLALCGVSVTRKLVNKKKA